jgi:crotonobetainyl-CoA:carnitine CoA-transferase CaiB-like acyl-CoA transferase
MRPLTGITILDMTRWLPGAVATLLLQRSGATVIKIEEPATGDPARSMPELFAATNGGKQSVALNLKSDLERQAFLALAKNADIVVESFRPGVMDRLGLSFDVLKGANPLLVVASLYGYPESSPREHVPGHDLNYLAVAGALDDPPHLSQLQIADIAAGALPLANRILLALLERQRTGKGSRITLNMVDELDPLLILPRSLAADHPLTGRYAFYNVYQCSDGRWIALGALEAKFWSNFCQAISRADLIGRQYDPAIVSILRGMFSERSAQEWVDDLGGKECCVTDVLRLDETQPAPRDDGPAPALGEQNERYVASLGPCADQRT